MSADPVFLDTVALLALTNRDDALHDRAKQVENDLTRRRARLVTSQWVLTEFLNSASRLGDREMAVRSVRRAQASPRTTIVRATAVAWQRGLDLYASRRDKEWSLTDCLSIQICQENKIEEVFSHDHHFEQAGFRILLA